MRIFVPVGLMMAGASLSPTIATAQPVLPPTVGPMVSARGPIMAPVYTGPMVSARGPVMPRPIVSSRGPMMPMTTVGPMVSPGGPVMNRSGWGHRVSGRCGGGVRGPPGWGAYRRPTAGFILPGYWLQPNYYISDYGAYGLPAPPAGHGWSRYYDDAVLTDEYGKVYDSRVGYDWDRQGGYDSSYDDGPRYRDGSYDRRDDRKIAREEMKQQRKLEKAARKAGYPSYAAYLRARNQRAIAHAPTPPHWAVRGGPEDRPIVSGAGAANVQTYTTPGHVAGGYYYPGTTVTTITLPPTVTTTTTTSYTTAAARPARARTKIIKRRAAACAC